MKQENADQGTPFRNNQNNSVSKYSLSSLKHAIVLGTSHFSEEFQEEIRNEIGIDLKDIYLSLVEYFERKKYEVSHFVHQAKKKTEDLTNEITRRQIWQRFSAWNRVELWKVHIGEVILYFHKRYIPEKCFHKVVEGVYSRINFIFQ